MMIHLITYAIITFAIHMSGNTFIEPGGKTFVQKTLVAFDADRIKGYVFGTDKLKEIRGASALLDKLNRKMMRTEAQQLTATQTTSGKIYPIYTNGGQGLFVVITDKEDASATKKDLATEFAQNVQREFAASTHGGASITYVLQPLPDELPDEIEALKKVELKDYFTLLQVKMELTKGRAADMVALPAHPFMRPCHACGIRYAEIKGTDTTEPEDQYLCYSCWEKQQEDQRIKSNLNETLLPCLMHKSGQKLSHEQNVLNRELWERILFYLQATNYDFFPYGENFKPQRPSDFHAFRPIAEAKEYLGLIYADANNMGAKVTRLTMLGVYQQFAESVDEAIHQAMSRAIARHLQIVQVDADEGDSENNGVPKKVDVSEDNTSPRKVTLFPFDIFIVGGDDVVMLTDATKAMEVALTIGQEFRAIMQEKCATIPELREIKDDQYSLAIGVVMAPIKYPFRLMRGLVENVLKDAKKEASQQRTKNMKLGASAFDDTHISFRIVNGGMQINADSPYHKTYTPPMTKKEQEFYATLRPFSAQDLDLLIQTIKNGQEMKLGRSKLHQMREAILHMNTTTSVSEGIAVLRNWSDDQRKFIMDYHRHYGKLYQEAVADPDNPLAGLPRLLFPWFLDKDEHYRTALLDLVELYDFVSRRKGGSDEQ